MAVMNINNVPGAVPYVSMTDDQSNAVLINALNERTKQYENQLNAIAENEALMNQMKVRDPDRAGAMVRAAKIAGDLDKEVQEKYAGDYASTGARKLVAGRLAQERGIFSTLQQKYEEEQPYRQMYNQLKMTGQLAQKFNPATGKIEEVNPFGQSIVDAEGNLVPQTNIDYGDIRKRGDYVDYIGKNIVDPLNKRMRDLGLKYKQGPFAFTKTSIQGKQVGMSPEQAAATVDDNVAKRFLEENPTFAFEYGTDIEKTKGFIKDIVRQKAIQQVDKQYGNLTDQWGMYNAKKKSEERQQPMSSNFLPPSQERGEMNPFVTERQQSGKSLQEMLKTGTGLMRTPYKNSAQAITTINQMIANQFKERGKYKNNPQTQILIDESIRQLRNNRSELLKYNKEVEERKTNWFNQAAQSLTGNPEASYKQLNSAQRNQIRNNAPKSEQQWAKLFDEDLSGKTLTHRTQRPLDPDIQKFIGRVTDLSGNYFRSSEGGTASKNLEDVAKESGIKIDALRQAIRTGEFPVQRIDATGEFAVRIPKDLKINKQGKLDYSKADSKNSVTIYHTFDEATQDMSSILRWAESNRFEIGKKSKVFNTPVGALTVEKTRQPNIYKVNGQPMTKEALERNILNATDEYITNTYKTKLPSKKLNQPTEDFADTNI